MKADIKINDKQLKMLCLLAGIVILFFAFRIGVTSIQAKSDVLEDEKSQLKTEITNMETLVADKEDYEKSTLEMNQEIDDVFGGIPAGLSSEDEIMYAVGLENEFELKINSMSMEPGTMLYSMNQTGENSVDNGKLLYGAPVTLECNITYQALKDCLQQISNEEKSKSVQKISFVFDGETGTLGGAITVNMYYILGSDKEYLPQSIDGISLGTANIFGVTADTVSPQSTPDDIAADTEADTATDNE